MRSMQISRLLFLLPVITGSLIPRAVLMAQLDEGHRVLVLDLPDCDGNGISDHRELERRDCDGNGLLDLCELRGGLEFQGPQHYRVPVDGPVDVIPEDLDGDGDLDLWVTARRDRKITLVENLGARALVPRVQLNAALSARVVSADFDGDGRIDVAVTTGSLDDRVRVFLGDDSGEFERVIDHLLPTYPIYLETLDVDGDGRSEIACVTRAGLLILFGAGNPEADILDIPIPNGIADFAPGDFDGDGHVDLGVAEADFLRIYRNLGDSSFEPLPFGDLEGSSYVVLSADFDGDGDPDVAVEVSGELTIHLNTGEGFEFETLESVPGPLTTTRIVRAGDADADGDIDVFANYGVFLNDGAARFTFVTTWPEQTTLWTAAADLDGDGGEDLIGPAEPGGIAIAWSDETPGFPPITRKAWSERPRPFMPFQDLAAADFDSDGTVDYLLSAPDSSPLLVLSKATGIETRILDEFFRRGLGDPAVADLDGDGDTDLLFPDSGARPLLNDGAGNFTGGTKLTSSTFSLLVSEIDGDPGPDAVVMTGSNVYVFLNDGEGEFASEIIGPLSPWPVTALATDLVGDDRLEVVTIRSRPWRLSLHASGEDDQPVVQEVNLEEYRQEGLLVEAPLLSPDLDGDGTPEILLAIQDTILVFGIDATGSLVLDQAIEGLARASTLEGRGPEAVRLETADVDRDGDLDVVATSPGDHQLIWLDNDGSGRLRARNRIALPSRPRDLTLIDVDGDEILEALIPTDALDILIITGIHRPPAPDIDENGRLDHCVHVQTPGDCNQSGTLEIGDAICMLLALFQGRALPCGEGEEGDAANLALLDWQPDSSLDLSDVAALLHHLFLRSPPHPITVEFGPGCVEMPGCAVSTNCDF